MVTYSALRGIPPILHMKSSVVSVAWGTNTLDSKWLASWVQDYNFETLSLFKTFSVNSMQPTSSSGFNFQTCSL